MPSVSPIAALPLRPMAIARKSYRTNDSEAASILERLIPAPGRRRLAEVFAVACHHAHLQAPSCWELTLEPTFVRLNVGQVALLDVMGRTLFLCAAPSLPSLASDAEVDRSAGPVYAAVPIRSVSLTVPLERVGIVDDRVLAAHLRYVAEAATRKRLSPFRAAHSPAAVRVLAEWAGVDATQPAYVSGPCDESELSQSEVEAALADVVASREVEESAVRTVREWYEARGWKVHSVEREKIGYDLRCSKGRERRRVEVKGRSGSGDVILLTANEWRRAVEDKAFVLAVVSQIRKSSTLVQMTGDDFQKSYNVRPMMFHASKRTRGTG